MGAIRKASNGAVLETNLPGAIRRLQGKVRDVYEYSDGMLLVASDRISAFDVVLPNGIPGKGKVLTQLSVFWFGLTKDIIPNHLISDDIADMPDEVQPYADDLAGRTMWCQKARVVPVECVVRGYMAGSGWKSYQKTGQICGNSLPPGLRESEKLPRLLFTPTTKEASGHDQPIDMQGVYERVGTELGNQLRDASIKIFERATVIAAKRGFLLVDTKFEFGQTIDGELILIDELLTPDSSRYWDASKHVVGQPNEAFDKQYVRNYLETLDWNKKAPGPELPSWSIAETRRIYQQAYRRITGMEPPA